MLIKFGDGKSGGLDIPSLYQMTMELLDVDTIQKPKQKKNFEVRLDAKRKYEEELAQQQRIKNKEI